MRSTAERQKLRGMRSLFRFKGKRSIKDMVEALGVPHTEINLILVNGISVSFDYILEDNERVMVRV
jgi:hypothetical protein